MSRKNELHAAALLLPWYVNGRISASDRARVDQALAESASLQSEQHWLSKIRDLLQNDQTSKGFDEEAGMATLMARVRAEKSGQVVSLKGRRAWQRWQGPALALAATLVVAQAGVIGHLMQQSASDPLGPLAAPAARGDLLQVVFRESSTEAQIRTALLAVGGEVVSGPGALGVYTVRVAAGSRATALNRLKAEAIVESVSIVESR